MPMPSAQSVARVALVLAALLSLTAVWVAIGAVLREAADQRIEAWSEAKPPTAEQWAAAERAIQRAEAFSLGSAELHDLRGRWHSWGALIAATPAVEVQQLRLARDAFRAAIALRPSWPYHWMNLAQTEYALNPRSAEGAAALEAALARGVRGLRLQTQLLQLADRQWSRWNDAQRAAVAPVLRRGFRERPERLGPVALGLGRMDWMCAQADLESVRAQCRALGW